LLMKLGALPFAPERLAASEIVSQQIFEIIPASRQMLKKDLREQLRLLPEGTEEDRRQRRIRRDAELIRRIPGQFGGTMSAAVFRSAFRDRATIFDLLNVFTEYAKAKGPAERIGIEERAGALARYIAANARKF